jgi:hypothetical protein
MSKHADRFIYLSLKKRAVMFIIIGKFKRRNFGVCACRLIFSPVSPTKLVGDHPVISHLVAMFLSFPLLVTD